MYTHKCIPISKGKQVCYMNANIEKLLKKKRLTGAEIGRLWVYNTLYQFGLKMQGSSTLEPLLTKSDFAKMLEQVTTPKGEADFNTYLTIESWLHTQIQHASSCKQQAMCNLELMLKYLLCADATEKVHYYLDQQPFIVTEEQIKYQKEKVKAPYFKDIPELSVCNLIAFALDWVLNEYEKDPKSNKNLLKPLKRELQGKAIISERILNSYNHVWECGAYILPDGRNSDSLSHDEWLEIVTPVLDVIENEYMEEEIGINEYVIKKHHIEIGSVQARETLAAFNFEWEYYDTPTALDKWQLILEGDFIYNYYEGLFSDNASIALESLSHFKEEYSELYEVIIFYVKQHFDEIGEIDEERWGNSHFSWKTLYDCEFAGFKEDNFDNPMFIWDGNRRAQLNGLAVYQPLTYSRKKDFVDENGHFIFPSIEKIYKELSPFMLTAFFSDSEFYESTVSDISGAREYFLDGYKRASAYNILLDMLASKYKIDGLDVVKMNLNRIEEKIKTFNFISKRLHKSIYETNYDLSDKDFMREKKLEIMKEFFMPIDLNEVKIPKENINKVNKLLTGFKAFQGDIPVLIDILCVPSKGE